MDDLMGLFADLPVAINVGARDFGEALEVQGVEVAYVEWSPPAGGDEELAGLLDLLL